MSMPRWARAFLNPFGPNPNIGRLFPDFVEQEKAYYKRTESIRSCIWWRYGVIFTNVILLSRPAFTTRSNVQTHRAEKMFNLRALRYMTPWLMRRHRRNP